MEKKILVFKTAGTVLSTRKNADEFFKEIKRQKAKDVILDFKKVEFMSRSFADQYLQLKIDSRIQIREINKNDEISRIIDFVERVRKRNEPDWLNIKYKTRKLSVA